MKEEKVCSHCGEVLGKGQVYEFGGEVMCKTCFDAKTVCCSHCGERIWLDDNYGSSSTVLCSRCYDNYYTTCERCNEVIRSEDALYFDEDDYPYCARCYDLVAQGRIIHNYNYKPEPIFYGDDGMYMGVELEIDHGGECSDTIQHQTTDK